MNLFKKGDKVTAYGLVGEVAEIVSHYGYMNGLTVRVLFVADGFDQWFTSEGLADLRHKEAVLRLVNPPKRLTKKSVFLAIKTDIERGSTRGGHATSYAHTKRENVVDSFLVPHQIVEVQIEVEE